MSQRRVDNSTFEQTDRYISGMHTDNPTISPQRYAMREKTPTGLNQQMLAVQLKTL